MQKIAGILKTRRKERGLSQTEVANILGISRQSVSKWENGSSYPDIENLIRLSDYYKIPVDELLKENSCIRIHKIKKFTIFVKK